MFYSLLNFLSVGVLLLLALVLAPICYLYNKKYTINGIVRSGAGNGDAAGAKTANLDISLARFPKGLWSCGVQTGSGEYHGLIYNGINFLTGQDCLEVHLLDYDGDLYGQTIVVTTKKFLRLPKKCNSLAELQAQIKKDLQNAR